MLLEHTTTAHYKTVLLWKLTDTIFKGRAYPDINEQYITTETINQLYGIIEERLNEREYWTVEQTCRETWNAKRVGEILRVTPHAAGGIRSRAFAKIRKMPEMQSFWMTLRTVKCSDLLEVTPWTSRTLHDIHSLYEGTYSKPPQDLQDAFRAYHAAPWATYVQQVLYRSFQFSDIVLLEHLLMWHNQQLIKQLGGLTIYWGLAGIDSCGFYTKSLSKPLYPTTLRSMINKLVRCVSDARERDRQAAAMIGL